MNKFARNGNSKRWINDDKSDNTNKLPKETGMAIADDGATPLAQAPDREC